MDIETTSLDKRIYKILRASSDTPRVLFRTPFPLLLQRHGGHKPVLLVSTRFFTYLIKVKNCALYTRWPNRNLTVVSEKDTLAIDSCPLEDEPPLSDGRTPGAVETSREEKPIEFQTVTLIADSAIEASEVEDQLTLLAHAARRTAALLEEEEKGASVQKSGASGQPQDGKAADGGESDAESSGSEAGDETGVLTGTAGMGGRKAAGEAVGAASVGAGTGSGGDVLLHMAPSRYIAITSLVDGEFADYATLKNAYIRKEEEALLVDLAAFIKENEGQVEALCEHHYPAFIHAAQQCLAISEKDAQLVGEELSGATELVRSAVMDMKQVAAHLVVSRSTRENLLQVRTLLTRCVAVAEYLHTAEAQVQKDQLFGAVTSIREMVRLAAGLAEYALGEYVLHVRVPALTRDVFVRATQHLNAWLKLLREHSQPIGRAALDWSGRVFAGFISKSIVMAEEGDYWWLTENFHEANFSMAAFLEAEAVRRISNGAAIQTVFAELRCDEYFCRSYTEGRAQQAKADIYEAPRPTAASGEALVASFEEYCVTALGFLLVEDVVYSATSPHAQSSAEFLRVWDRATAAISERARSLSQALLADPQYTTYMLRVFKVLRGCVHMAVDNVKSVELNPVALARVIETLSDNLVSWWLQDACLSCTEAIFGDMLIPLTVSDAASYEANVSRFHLNKCSLLELPIPSSYTTNGVVTLPYSSAVPTVGAKALDFLSQCYMVIVMDAAAAVRQSELNNVDEMLIKYVSVLFRTISETLHGKLMSLGSREVMPHAVFVTSCSVMPVIVSCVEQQFMLRWQGDYVGVKVQELGAPKLFAHCAALYNKPIQKGIEGLLAAYIGEVEGRLKVTATLTYWAQQVALRNGETHKRGADDVEGFSECMDYTIGLIGKLKDILQTTVVRSVVGTAMAHAGMAMQSSIETAIFTAYRKDDERDFVKMRACLSEFESQCAMLVPLWRSRLRELLPGITAGERFPLNAHSTVEDMVQWLNVKEAQYQAERAAQPQLLVGIGDATKAMTRGLQAVGKTVAATKGAFSKKE